MQRPWQFKRQFKRQKSIPVDGWRNFVSGVKGIPTGVKRTLSSGDKLATVMMTTASTTMATTAITTTTTTTATNNVVKKSRGRPTGAQVLAR